MRTKIIEWRQQRAELIADARTLNDQVEGESRDFTAEEQAQWDSLMADADSLRTKIEREERLLQQEGELAGSDRNSTLPDPEGQPGESGGGNERHDPRASEEYRTAFNSYLRAGEQRAILQADQDEGGGFLVAPMQFVNEFIKNVDDMVMVRQWARAIPVPTARSLGAPKLVSDPDDFEWTSELATGTEDTAMEFGRRNLYPHPLAKRIKESRTLLRMVPDVDSFVMGRLAYKHGVTQEKAFLTGSGSQQPLGVFTASNEGISTARDVSADNTTTAVTADGLINAKYTLKTQYWPRARWMFHRDTVKILAKLKDSDGQYLWRESVRVGEPDRFAGIPLFMSEFCPNTLTTGQYVGILGDWSHYWIADALDMSVQRLNELYAESNQIGIILRSETDGMPVLEEAFVRVKLA